MTSLKSVPTINQMRVQMARIRSSMNWKKSNTTELDDTPFGGEYDSMMAYDFISLKTDRFFHSIKHSSAAQAENAKVTHNEGDLKVINKKTEEAGGTSNLLCYADGLEGVGKCRIMLTTGDNKLFKGDPKEFGAVGVKQVYLKSISITKFVMCYDSLGPINAGL